VSTNQDQFQVGDIANGHILSEDGTWAPIAPPPAAAAVDEPKKRSWVRRHKFLTALVAVGAIVAVGSAVGGGDEPSDAASGTAATEQDAALTEEAAEALAGIGTAVQDGKFEFVVEDVKTGVTSIGGEYLSTEAQGEYTVVTMTVENIGDEPQTFFDSNIKGVDSQGREIAADSEAGIYANTDDAGNSLIEEINPGNSMTVKVVFDLAAGETLKALELHDSAFSGGVEVSLA
jgi:hypothetical protein